MAVSLHDAPHGAHLAFYRCFAPRAGSHGDRVE